MICALEYSKAFYFMKTQIKTFLFFVATLTVAFLLFLNGPALAQGTDKTMVSKAIYENPAYIQEGRTKVNCELNGAWTSEYKYYWLPGQINDQNNLPPFVKNISLGGVIQDISSIGLSTPESTNIDSERNKYFLTSSLPGETVEITLNLEHNNPFVEWFPISLYFDPFVVNNLQQQVKIKLSYADSNLGDVVYIQNVGFSEGCYLNLLVKAPPQGQLGKLTIELKPENNYKGAISGIFWSDERKETDLHLTYSGATKISAANWNENQKMVDRTVIWSPQTDQNQGLDKLVRISLGDVVYTTSTGLEFPLDTKNKTYNFKILKGQSGPLGFNGIEFYLKPELRLCTDGCELGLYFTQQYQQSIYVYSAFEDKKNKLLAKVETNSNGLPSFEKFYLSPNDNVSLRVRITTNDETNPPVLRGLYILSSDNNDLLTLDSAAKPDESKKPSATLQPTAKPEPSPMPELTITPNPNVASEVNPTTQTIIIVNGVIQPSTVPKSTVIQLAPITEEHQKPEPIISPILATITPNPNITSEVNPTTQTIIIVNGVIQSSIVPKSNVIQPVPIIIEEHHQRPEPIATPVVSAPPQPIPTPPAISGTLQPTTIIESSTTLQLTAIPTTFVVLMQQNDNAENNNNKVNKSNNESKESKKLDDNPREDFEF